LAKELEELAEKKLFLDFFLYNIIMSFSKDRGQGELNGRLLHK